jgi:6-pyruvoyl-tetrahydropterin synthase related domain
MTRGGTERLVAGAILLAVAALLALPAALGPIRLNDSFWIDLVWLEQFTRELGNGTVYPRWLPLSHAGLGSPVFYYYPPLAFYLASAFGLLGLSTFPALVAAFGAATLLSGVGVYLWLKDQTRTPLLGALLFMIAPYQLFDFYQRGAIAEFVATAILPFVLVGIRRILQARREGFWIMALAYAALVMSHLPMALLGSIFLFAPYALARAWKSPPMLLRIGAALALGIALSAIYLLPAVELEQYRSSRDLWAFSTLQPTTWNLWNARAWSDQTFRAVMLVSAALGIPAVALVIRDRSAWSIWSVVCLAIAVGTVPVLWSLPGLSLVQFPFRLLPVAELAFVTALTLTTKDRAQWLVAWVAFLLMAGFIIAAQPETANFGDRVMRQFHPDVPENLPPGHRPYSWPSKWALEVASTHRQRQFDGKITVEPVFYFPAWQVHCAGVAVPTFATQDQQLLAYQGRGCSRRLVPTTAERIGELISLLALLLVSVSFQARPRLPAQPLPDGIRPNSEAASREP